MAMNSEYRGTASNVAKKKAATKSKTVVTPGTKVSQATIDKIKAMGMTKALKGAANASPEMREGLKRLYGAKRVAAALPSKPAAKSADEARANAMKPAKGAVYKSADAARSAASKPAKPVAKSADAARMGANTVMAPSNPNRQNMPYKTPGAKPVQKDMYGNKVKSGVIVSAPKKQATTSSKKNGYKAGTQKDLYGNKIK